MSGTKLQDGATTYYEDLGKAPVVKFSHCWPLVARVSPITIKSAPNPDGLPPGRIVGTWVTNYKTVRYRGTAARMCLEKG